MSSLLTFLKKRERSLNLSTLKKSCFLKLALLVNFLLWCFKTEKKIWKIIFWRYWNSYYLMLLIRRYFKLVYKFDFMQYLFWYKKYTLQNLYVYLCNLESECFPKLWDESESEMERVLKVPIGPANRYFTCRLLVKIIFFSISTSFSIANI